MFNTCKNIIVASNSPRRQQFFKDLGINFCVPSINYSHNLISLKNTEIAKTGILGCNDLEERPQEKESPLAYAIRMANKKVIEFAFSYYNKKMQDQSALLFDTVLANKYEFHLSFPITRYDINFFEQKEQQEENIILSADTIVCLGDEILGKPKSKDEALAMLRSLVGRSHFVITAVSIINTKEQKLYSFYDQTKVDFMPWSFELLKAYVDTGESLDKAGAYGISGLGSFLSNSIQGSWDTVVGLPIAKCVEFLLWHKAICIKEV